MGLFLLTRAFAPRGTVSSRALVVLALLLSVGTPVARGQAAVRADHFTVALWPEYDRPAVLVTYRLELSPEVALPAQIDLPIPADVGDPHAVAKRGTDGTLYLAPAIRIVQGEWAVIQVTTDRPQVQLEYYAPFSTSTDERSFSYRWPGGLEIAAFNYEVLPPVAASNVTVTPPPARVQMTELGVPLHLGELGPRAAAQQETIAIRYTNPGGRLSVTPAPAPPAVSPPPLVSSRDELATQEPTTAPLEREGTTSGLAVPILLGIAAVVLVGLWFACRRPRAGGA
jgi:hypothetical protein